MKKRNISLLVTVSCWLISPLTAQAKTIKLGDHLGGGIVYFLDDSSENLQGLIVAEKDAPVSMGYRWGGFNNVVTTAEGLYAGEFNTEQLLKQSGGSEAATIAQTYLDPVTCEAPITYCSTWYLPSQSELMVLWASRKIIQVNNFESAHYWSSTEGNNYHTAWRILFEHTSSSETGMAGSVNKQSAYGVRAIRYFRQ